MMADVGTLQEEEFWFCLILYRWYAGWFCADFRRQFRHRNARTTKGWSGRL